MAEVWRPVVGYEGLYEVSDLGRVRSLGRCNPNGQRWAAKIMACPVDVKGSGYRFTGLSKGGVVKKQNIHILVLEAFIGQRPSPSHHACHADGNRTNPSLANLRWDTQAANWSDRWKHGTATAGEKSGSAILTTELVIWIRESRQSSLKLAPVLGVASSTIRAVRSGQNWRHM